MQVCEKVEGKGRTTYNEVADELVADMPDPNEAGVSRKLVLKQAHNLIRYTAFTILPKYVSVGGSQFDEKNIRRRVYDALNVLMAMDIITRERKEIFWKGLPSGPQLSLDRLRNEKQRLAARIEQQRTYIEVFARFLKCIPAISCTKKPFLRFSCSRRIHKQVMYGDTGAGAAAVCIPGTDPAQLGPPAPDAAGCWRCQHPAHRPSPSLHPDPGMPLYLLKLACILSFWHCQCGVG